MLEDRREVEWNLEGPDLLIVVIVAVNAIGREFRHSCALSLRLLGLVRLHHRVYLFCPGLNPSLQVLDLLEAKTLQKPHRLGASHPRVAVNDYLVGGVQLVGSLRKLSERNHSRPFYVTDLVLEWFSDVQYHNILLLLY